MSKDLIIILDNIRSTLNVGAILRTCDGAGVSKLMLCGITPHADHPKVVKTALGAENFVKCEYFANTMDAVTQVEQQGYTPVVVEQTPESVEYQNFDFPSKIALILGHEITGVQRSVLEKVKSHVQLPMQGRKNSLNVATTAGILIYHLQFVTK